MYLKALLIILFTILNLTLGQNKTQALDTPNFPTCQNPQGAIKAQYNEGNHGIVGDSATYTGKDTVYQINADTFLQCFCSPNGQGIQTNWWKVSSLNQEEIQILKNSGWIYIPNGSLWGLENAPYLTKNFNFSCSNNNNTENNLQGGTGGGSILGVSATGDVLGLASTGNNTTVYLTGLLSVLLLLVGTFLKIQASKNHPG